MNNFLSQVPDLTPTQKLIGNIIFFVGVGLYLVFGLLAMILLPHSKVGLLVSGLLAACAFVLIVVSFVQINTVLMWLGWLLCGVAVLAFLVTFDILSLARYYPLIIFSFGMASLLTLPFSIFRKIHIVTIGVFGVFGGIMCLGSMGVIGYLWTVFVLILYLCALIAMGLRVSRRYIKRYI
jgi:hypothetical protein